MRGSLLTNDNQPNSNSSNNNNNNVDVGDDKDYSLNRPWLSGGPWIVEENNGESEFSKLLGHLAMPNPSNDDDHPSSIPWDDSVDPIHFEKDAQEKQYHRLRRPHPFITSIGGTLCLLHFILVWSSYAADHWMEHQIHFVSNSSSSSSSSSSSWNNYSWSFSWEYFTLATATFWGNPKESPKIGSLNLMTLLRDWAHHQHFFLVVSVWTISLLIPCIFMIFGPVFVFWEASREKRQSWTARGFLVSLLRWAWFPFFYFILALALSNVEFQPSHDLIQIQTGYRPCGPLASYGLGMACAVAVVVLLRCSFDAVETLQTESLSTNALSRKIHSSREGPNSLPPSTPPPPQAFLNLWRISQNNAQEGNPPGNQLEEQQQQQQQHDEPVMTVLEEAAAHGPRPAREPRISMEPSSLQNYNNPHDSTVDNNTTGDSRRCGDDWSGWFPVIFWHKFMALQLGGLSILLWIPALYFPILQRSYGGLATNWITHPIGLEKNNNTLYMWELGFLSWHWEIPVWIRLIVPTILLLVTGILPLVTTFLALAIWTTESTQQQQQELRSRYLTWLFALYPSLAGLVLSMALLAIVQIPLPLQHSGINIQPDTFCQNLTGQECLDITIQALPGLWFFLLQSICLEFLVLVTLQWA